MATWKVKKNKFKARKTEYNGVMYDSKGEADLALQIDAMILSEDEAPMSGSGIIASGRKIVSVARQVEYELRGAGGAIVCKHEVDFVVELANGTIEVMEFKGVKTPDWSIKHKLFIDNYPYIPYRVFGLQKRKRSSRRKIPC